MGWFDGEWDCYPFFFRQNIDGDDYLQLINEQVVPALQRFSWYRGRRNDQFQCLWWLQDSAPCHSRRPVTDRLTELFGNQVIAINRAVEWPSPDLTPLDFFL